MKNRLKLIRFAFLIVSLTATYACSRNKSANLPLLETIDATEITQSSAKAGGIITSDGGEAITARGVCWDILTNPDIAKNITNDGTGSGNYLSSLTNLSAGTTYYFKAYATNSAGTSYGDEKSFKTSSANPGQIIADHTIVSDFNKIPQTYINLVKKMWVSYAGESHSAAVRTGANLLEASYPAYQVNVTESGTPEAFTDQHLRLSCATWGDYYDASGWIYSYGEEDWFTNSTAISRTKAGIMYCNTHSLAIAAIGFGWCYDMVYNSKVSAAADPVFGCHWYGSSRYGKDGSMDWGLDSEDYSLTGNTVCMDTYLSVTEEYISYCSANGYATKVFFTTGPVDDYYTDGEAGYQGSVKHEYIRNYVKANPARILFDYADILCYDDNGKPTTRTWNGHTYPYITATNLTPVGTGHISNAGAKRLAKAMWWMLARIAGWDGN